MTIWINANFLFQEIFILYNKMDFRFLKVESIKENDMYGINGMANFRCIIFNGYHTYRLVYGKANINGREAMDICF